MVVLFETVRYPRDVRGESSGTYVCTPEEMCRYLHSVGATCEGNRAVLSGNMERTVWALASHSPIARMEWRSVLHRL